LADLAGGNAKSFTNRRTHAKKIPFDKKLKIIHSKQVKGF